MTAVLDGTLIMNLSDTIDEFFNSPLGQRLGKGSDSQAKRIRKYRKDKERGKLSPKQALLLLFDLDLIEDIKYKNLNTQK